MREYSTGVSYKYVIKPDNKRLKPSRLEGKCISIYTPTGDIQRGGFHNNAVRKYGLIIGDEAVECYRQVVKKDRRRLSREDYEISGIIKRSFMFIPEIFIKKEDVPVMFFIDKERTKFYDASIELNGKEQPVFASLSEREYPVYLTEWPLKRTTSS